MSMVKTIFHLFKIHRKMVFGNSSVVVQDMLGITPKSLNAVDVVLAFVGKDLAVVQAVVFAPALQGVVATKGIRVIDRPLSRMLPNMGHQFIGRYPFHNFGINSSIALQKAENNAFPDGASAALPLPSAAEVSLINLNLSLELACFQFSHMIDRFAQALIDAAHHLIIKAEIARHAIGRLLLVEAGDNANLFAQAFERLLFSTSRVPALHIAALSFTDVKRTAEYALSAPQKVGRTVENILLPSNHKGILTPRGYETH